MVGKISVRAIPVYLSPQERQGRLAGASVFEATGCRSGAKHAIGQIKASPVPEAFLRGPGGYCPNSGQRQAEGSRSTIHLRRLSRCGNRRACLATMAVSARMARSKSSSASSVSDAATQCSFALAASARHVHACSRRCAGHGVQAPGMGALRMQPLRLCSSSIAHTAPDPAKPIGGALPPVCRASQNRRFRGRKPVTAQPGRDVEELWSGIDDRAQLWPTPAGN
jgi:hypothetical protein